MKSSQKLRFRLWPGCDQLPPPSSNDSETLKGRHASRSRAGCTECKRRRVKCDETFPVCLRCQKRGSFCRSAPRLTKWQIEAPWINHPNGPPSLPQKQTAPAPDPDDKALLQYWLERASQIMVIDPDENPLSFPILEYVNQSPSLKHALRSVGAGHRNYFDPERLAQCLEERSSALKFIIEEISCPGDNLFPLFLSVLLVGLSTAWTNGPTADFGEQHFHGARGLVDILLSESTKREKRPPYFNFVVGAYLYWDMATAFLVPVHKQVPINTDDMYSAILDVGQEYHPIGGYSTEIFYLLGTLGRYCRSVVETGIRDGSVESALEEEMEKWEPNRESPELGIVSDAFRSHGLINLAAICYRRPRKENPLDSDLADILNLEPGESLEPWQTTEEPLVDVELEDSIRTQALAVNHLRANLTALQILPEIWQRRDAGENISWLEVMLEKGWNVMLG